MTKSYDALIIGAGPAGIFTALELNKLDKKKKIIIIDKGSSLDKRKCPEKKLGYCLKCKVCHVTSGWSGAGAFSDGKLSLSPEVGGRITEYMPEEKAQEYIKYADDFYTHFGARRQVYGLNNERVEEIEYECSKHNIKLVACPVRHLGTEHAYKVLTGMYDHLLAEESIEFLELTTAEDLIVENNEVKGAVLNVKGEKKTVLAENVIVAPGRVGAGWLKEQADKLNLITENNEIDIGVRVEVPNSVMDHLTKDLYEAKMFYYSDTFDNKVRTFCMNPGGIVSAESYENLTVVNGHSYADPELKTKNTNFSLLVSTKFTEPFKQPIEYGNHVANLANMLTGGGIMVQRLGDLLQGRRTDPDRLKKSTTIPTLKSAVPGDLSYVLPHRYLTSIVEAIEAFDKIAPGLNSKNTLLYGVEVKFYSSKVKVKDNFETSIKNLYMIGDGAGITRGLMQASVTGIVVARDIIDKSEKEIKYRDKV